MGIYVRIDKIFESDLSVKYTFKNERGESGVLELNKITNEIVLLNMMPGDDRMHCFRRATYKVSREWERGNLPQFLEWAS